MEGNISNNSQDLLYNTQRINWFVAFYVNAIKQNRYTFISITVNPLNTQCVMCPKSDNRRKGGCILTEWWFDLFSSHHVWCGYICSNALLPPPHDPTPICAPWGCMHQSSLIVYPRQQSSEHLATVTQQHTYTRLIGSSPWQVNVLCISISYKIQLNFHMLLPHKARPAVTRLSGALLNLFISASQHHCPDQSPPSSRQQSANFSEILPSWD